MPEPQTAEEWQEELLDQSSEVLHGLIRAKEKIEASQLLITAKEIGKLGLELDHAAGYLQEAAVALAYLSNHRAELLIAIYREASR